jgi:uncharacterized metal-binding protein YceD (DUF177 family)
MPQVPAFRVNTRQVVPSGTDLSFEVPVDWLRRELLECDVSPAGGPGSFDINVAPTQPGFYVTGTIRVGLQTTCVRCLRAAPLHLAIPFKVHMAPGPPLGRDDEDVFCDDGSLGAGRYQGEEMVLDSLVRESIVLALPMNPHCPEGCSVEDLYREDE